MIAEGLAFTDQYKTWVLYWSFLCLDSAACSFWHISDKATGCGGDADSAACSCVKPARSFVRRREDGQRSVNKDDFNGAGLSVGAGSKRRPGCAMQIGRKTGRVIRKGRGDKKGIRKWR